MAARCLARAQGTRCPTRLRDRLDSSHSRSGLSFRTVHTTFRTIWHASGRSQCNTVPHGDSTHPFCRQSRPELFPTHRQHIQTHRSRPSHDIMASGIPGRLQLAHLVHLPQSLCAHLSGRHHLRRSGSRCPNAEREQYSGRGTRDTLHPQHRLCTTWVRRWCGLECGAQSDCEAVDRASAGRGRVVA